MKHKKHPNILESFPTGFTLLEILLVLTILVVMAAAGLVLYQRHSTTAKINQTAEQMRQLLQAASNYFVDNGSWPTTTSQPAFSLYVSASLINPWGNSYTYQPEPQYGKKYQIRSGNLPDTQLAQRVAALLPAAGLDPQNPNQVLAEVITPKVQQAPSRYLIKIISYTSLLNNNELIAYSFTCPPGWQADTFAVPYYIDTDRTSSCIATSRTFATLAGGANCQWQGDSANTYNCTITPSLSGYELDPWKLCTGGRQSTDARRAGFFYIGWCENPNPQKARAINFL